MKPDVVQVNDLDALKKKHTPGPWHWESDPVKNDPLGRVRYQVTALGKTITQVYYSSHEGGLTNAEADARLIAAAPELLAVIKVLRRAIVSGSYFDPPNAIKMIDGAISKVTP